MLESMSNFGSVLGAPIGGMLLDIFFDKDLGLPDPFRGTMLPFLIAGGLGMLTVLMVQTLVKEKPLPNMDRPDG
jgi:MFS family permease